mgnify:CR=1 FL=1
MDFLHIVTQMLMIFGIVLVGLFAAKRNLWSGDLDRKLSIFIMNVSVNTSKLNGMLSTEAQNTAFEPNTASHTGYPMKLTLPKASIKREIPRRDLLTLNTWGMMYANPISTM